MRTFFHGWRRKAGVATLAVACLSATLWIRSFVVEVRLAIKDVNFVARSTLGGFGWSWDYQNEIAEDPAVEWMYCPIRDLPSIYRVPAPIPYWPVVLPLTLLSAYLILWKPRNRDA